LCGKCFFGREFGRSRALEVAIAVFDMTVIGLEYREAEFMFSAVTCSAVGAFLSEGEGS
jgi:hypothetical protein